MQFYKLTKRERNLVMIVQHIF